MLEIADQAPGPKIKVIGVGGGGGNAVNTMIEAGIQGVDFMAANTDCQVLDTNQAPIKIQLGRNLTKGLGAGANPEIGHAAALEDAARLGEVLAGADMVFVCAGMGGGTGTGAAPVIAQVARDIGALTVGVVTRPFAFEGNQRKKKATGGVAELAKAVDALIVIPNDRLVALAGHKLTLRDSFVMVDNVCLNAVRGISDLVLVPGLINVDFADVRTIMTGMGRALMGTGRGAGDKRALEAAQIAVNSPLLEDATINGATGILVNITGGPDLKLGEVQEACQLIQDASDPDANIIFGSVIDPNMGDEVRITVIATGFQTPKSETAAPFQGGRSHGARRPGEGQMALPMQPTPHGTLQATLQATMHGSMAGAMPQAVHGTIQTGIPVGAQPLPLTLGQDYDFDEPEIETYSSSQPPLSPLPLSPSFATGLPPGGAEWGPGSEGRPVIRPQVASPMAGPPTASGGAARRSGATPTALAAEELGVGDTEFDRPAFLRRSRPMSSDAAGVTAPGRGDGSGPR